MALSVSSIPGVEWGRCVACTRCFGVHRESTVSAVASKAVGTSRPCFFRCGSNENMINGLLMATIHSWRTRRCRITCPAYVAAASASSLFINDSSTSVCQKVLKGAREKFAQEISFQSKDKDISLAKALLYIAAEDEAFLAFSRVIDAQSVINEGRECPLKTTEHKWDSLDTMPLSGKNISEWLNEFDVITKEVEAELVSRDIGCHLAEVLEAVNLVLFQFRGFKRLAMAVDSKFSYLPNVLNSGRGTAILVSIVYMEVCWRLGLTIFGSRVGENFLVWPKTENPEELFKVTSGHSLFSIVNGKCVEDPRSMASDLNSKSLQCLETVSNRDIIGIALANLIRLHWKRASRLNHGLMLTSALRPVHQDGKKYETTGKSSLLRPQDLRLAIMASERLLILQPHNWVLRRDHGLMLYYSREYVEAVQELSICMACAPEEEAAILEPFVEKLHLLKLESTWEPHGHVETVP